MKISVLYILIILLMASFSHAILPKQVYRQNLDKICLVSFYQNIASDSRIGSFNKIRKHRTGIVVGSQGLIMLSSDIYPVSLDIISNHGSLLTGKPSDIKVKLSNGKEFTADFLGKDDQAQVAFIRISNLPADSSIGFADFGAKKNLAIADSVYILEFLPGSYNYQPLFTVHSVNAEIESPRKKYLIYNYTPALSACGLVLDGKGNPAAITLKQTIDFSFRPPEEFEDFHKDFLEIAPAEWFTDLIQNPPKLEESITVQKSWLGIRMQGLSTSLKDYWNVPQKGGIVINRVLPESPADRAGLRIGDIILQVNDSALTVRKDEDTENLQTLIRSLPPGTEIKLKVFRNGKTIQKKVTLSAAPKSIGLAESYAIPEQGFEIRELTRDILYQENLPLSTPGVLVYQVDRASPAGLGGLQVGDIIQEINGTKISDFEQAKRVIEKLNESTQKIFMLTVLENRSSRFVFIHNKD